MGFAAGCQEREGVDSAGHELAGCCPGAGDWYWVADATMLPGPAGTERFVVFLWRTARTTADTLGFKSVGSALAIIDDPAADSGDLAAAAGRDTGRFSRKCRRTRRKDAAEILWGSDLFVDLKPTRARCCTSSDAACGGWVRTSLSFPELLRTKSRT